MFDRVLAAAAVCAAGVLVAGAADEPAKPWDAAEVRAADLEKALAGQKGKVVLVDCWATWCGPCVKKFPQLVALHKKYAEKGLVVVGFNLERYGGSSKIDRDEIVTFLREQGAAFPNYIAADPKKDEEALLKLLGDYSALPHLALFDRAGKKVWDSEAGPKLDEAALEKRIEEELAKKP